MNRLLIGFVLSLACISGCVRREESKATLASQMHEASESYTGFLGSGFQSDSKRFTDNHCIDSDATHAISVMNDGKIKAGIDLSEQDMQSFFGGALSTSFPVFPGISVSGSIGLDHSLLANQNAETISLLYKGEGSYEGFTDDSLQLSAFAKDLLQDPRVNPELLYKTCGDHYVKGIERGVMLLATLKMTYDGNAEDNGLRGSVSVGISAIGGGALKSIEAMLPKIEIGFDGDQKLKTTKVRFELNVMQKGGQPEKLLSLLPTSAAESGALVCTFENRAMCLQSFLKVAAYIRDEVPQQLQVRERLVPISYITDEYVQGPVIALAQGHALVTANQDANERLIDKRRQLSQAYDQSSSDRDYLIQLQKNVGDLSQELGESLNSCTAQSDRSPLCSIADQLQKVSKKREIIAYALSSCDQLQEAALCAAAFADFELINLDPSYRLDRAKFENMPQSFSTWCQLYFVPDMISPERRQTIGALLQLGGFPVNDAFAFILKKADPMVKASDLTFSLTDACGKTHDALKSMGSMNLTNQGLKDLLPLASFFQLKSLTLTGNNLQAQDLWPLTWMKGLGCLDLRNNLFERADIPQGLELAAEGTCQP